MLKPPPTLSLVQISFQGDLSSWSHNTGIYWDILPVYFFQAILSLAYFFQGYSREGATPERIMPCRWRRFYEGSCRFTFRRESHASETSGWFYRALERFAQMNIPERHMKRFVLFFRDEPVRPTSDHEMLFQISPPQKIHNEIDGVCHVLPFRVCLTFTWRKKRWDREKLWLCWL